jgi:uncharacterized protein YjbI with pentapeptide repeats
MPISPIKNLVQLKEAAKLCSNKALPEHKHNFFELLDEVTRASPEPIPIPDTWKTLDSVPEQSKESTFVGCHPQHPDNKMVFISDQPRKDIDVVGDFHADVTSLYNILENIDFFGRDPKPTLVLLGDYLDRGKESFETLSAALLLKRDFPDRVFLLKGNHEEKLGLDPNTMPDQGYTPDESDKILSQLAKILPLAAIYGNTLFVHSALGKLLLDGNQEQTSQLNDIIEEELNVLWKDDVNRGVGDYFKNWEEFIQSFDVTKKLGFQQVVRGHSHKNDLSKTSEEGIQVYTLLSTGAGSQDACVGYTTDFPKILEIPSEGPPQFHSQISHDLQQKQESLEQLCQEKGIETQNGLPIPILMKLLQMREETLPEKMSEEEYTHFVRAAYSEANRNIYDVIKDDFNFGKQASPYLILFRSQFGGVTWDQGDLNHARIDNCSISQSSFKGTNLTGATILESYCQHSDFIQASFNGTHFTNSSFGISDFTRADLSDITYVGGIFLNNTCTEAIFCRAIFKNTDLSYSEFFDADLRGAQFTDVVLDNVKWRGVKIDATTSLDWEKYGQAIVSQNISYLIGQIPSLEKESKENAMSYITELIQLINSKIGRTLPEEAMLSCIDSLDFSALDLTACDLSGFDLRTIQTQNTIWFNTKIDKATQLNEGQWQQLIEQNFDLNQLSALQTKQIESYTKYIPPQVKDTLPQLSQNIIALLTPELKLSQKLNYVLSQEDLSLIQKKETIETYLTFIKTLYSDQPEPTVSEQNVLSIVRMNFNCTGQDLSGRDFSNFNLSGTDFHNANLDGANFEGASLRGADLLEASLKRVDFRGADLRKTKLDLVQSWGGVKIDAYTKLPSKMWRRKWLRDNLLDLSSRPVEADAKEVQELFRVVSLSDIRTVLSNLPGLKKWIQNLNVILPQPLWKKTIAQVHRLLSKKREKPRSTRSIIGDLGVSSRLPKSTTLSTSKAVLTAKPTSPTLPSSIEEMWQKVDKFLATNPRVFNKDTYRQMQAGFELQTYETEKQPSTITYSEEIYKTGEYTIQLPYDIDKPKRLDPEQTKSVFAKFAQLAKELHPGGIDISEVPNSYKEILIKEFQKAELKYHNAKHPCAEVGKEELPSPTPTLTRRP